MFVNYVIMKSKIEKTQKTLTKADKLIDGEISDKVSAVNRTHQKNTILLFVKSSLFNMFFLVWTLVWGGALLPVAICSKKAAFFIGYIWSVVLLKALKVICNISHEIEGIYNIPKESCIVASKHESTWDTVFLLQSFYNPVFILKRELIYIPVYGLYLLCMGMIHINRKQKRKSVVVISDGSKNVIQDNRKIIIFPQGTRTAPNEKQSYKSGIYAISKETNLPILPIVLNSGRLWGKNAFMKYPGVIKVKIMPLITPNYNSKKIFMESLENNIESEYKTLDISS